jgi:hypothetical protein
MPALKSQPCRAFAEWPKFPFIETTSFAEDEYNAFVA